MLFRSHGNLAELCKDVFDAAGYVANRGNNVNPPGPIAGGNTKVIRGGSWLGASFEPRSAYRFTSVAANAGPTPKMMVTGLRPKASAKKPKLAYPMMAPAL